ncbi:MAG: hypothetical protein KC417_13875, partial [Myxococcales bacterium]|nr:hypothetical protein [Myxococcales bacterium]
GYIKRSKTAEAPLNLSAMFRGAASYYNREVATKGISASASGNCTIGSTTGTTPATASDQKQFVDFSTVAQFQALAFSSPDPVYYTYGITSSGETCGNTRDMDLYTFYAIGNLDNDSDESLFEMAAGSDGSNILRHATGLYVVDEIE